MVTFKAIGLSLMLVMLVACEADKPAATNTPESSAGASALAPMIGTMERAEATGALSGARIDELNKQIEQKTDE